MRPAFYTNLFGWNYTPETGLDAAQYVEWNKRWEADVRLDADAWRRMERPYRRTG